MVHPSRMRASILSYNQHFMGNTVAPEVEGAENLDRRNFLKNALGALASATVLGTASLAQETLAQEVTPVSENLSDFSDIEYRESKLGIDYHALADAPVDAMLSQGEAEFMENATPVFEEETAEAWGHYMAPEIATGRVSKATVESMREFTPNMLLSFAYLDPNGKYSSLSLAGQEFGLDRNLG